MYEALHTVLHYFCCSVLQIRFNIMFYLVIMAHIKNSFVSYHSIYWQNLFNTTPYFPNILGKQTFTAPLKTLLLDQSASLNHISIS
jgi:hypothetical protein